MATSLCFDGESVPVKEGQSVLDALLAADIKVPYSCRTGLCQSCLLRTEASLPAQAQQGLRPSLIAQGYFLACRCFPRSDLAVFPAHDSDLLIGVRLDGKRALCERVWRLRLSTSVPLFYHAGQFINLDRGDGLRRSYSLASLPGRDPCLEIHVQRKAGGLFSNWLLDEAGEGTRLMLQGPLGHCFYIRGDPAAPILMVGTGSGLAPLWGIARDALESGHTGPIHLYHGSHSEDGLYAQRDLLALDDAHPQFSYHPCISGPEFLPSAQSGRADQIALQAFPDLTGWQVFLCGHPEMVRQMQRLSYLAGARLEHIRADPFEMRELRQHPREGNRQA